MRDLSPESHGNAAGLGMSDFTTARLVRSIDLEVTYLNCLTSLVVLSPKIPIHFETDRQVIAAALQTLALTDPLAARVVRIRDTLSLTEIAISQGYQDQLARRADLTPLGPPTAMQFDAAGNLTPL